MANSHYLFCKISVQKQRWHEILWFLLRTPTLGVRVLLPLGWNTCLPINFDIENFGWKTCEVEKGGIILLIFSCGGAFNVGWWGLVRLVLYNSLQLQILCTYSLPTLYIYSTSDRRRIWNPVEHLRWRFFAEIVNVLRVEHLRWRFFAEIVNVLRPLAIFEEELHRVSLTKSLTGF